MKVLIEILFLTLCVKTSMYILLTTTGNEQTCLLLLQIQMRLLPGF